MPGTIELTTPNDSYAELKRVASILNKVRRPADAAGQAPLYIRVGDAAGQRNLVEFAVSQTTLNQIAWLIENAGAEDSPRTRRNSEELSTQKAANLLGVSRPYLVKLLDTGKIPYRLVGRYRRVRRADLEQFERDDQKRRRAGLEELAAFTQEIGLEY